MRKPAILVTGAAGCIGSNLCNYIHEKHPEYKILALDDLSGGEYSFFSEPIRAPKSQHELFIRSAGGLLRDIFEKNDVRIVYHAAAIAAESISAFCRRHYYRNNIVVSSNIINYCIEFKVDRLVYFSSMAVYGNNEAPFTEDQVPSPIDPYGIGKYAVEMDLACAKRQHGLRWTIVRPHSVYGPYQNIWDKYRNVLGIWMRQIMNGEPVSIYGTGNQRRAFTYVDDIMEPLWLCGTSETTLHETFNLGSDNDMELIDALKILEEVVGAPVEKKYYPPVHEVANAFSDHKLAELALNLKCSTDLKEGLTRMWEWAKVQPKQPCKEIIFELTDGLYEQFK